MKKFLTFGIGVVATAMMSFSAYAADVVPNKVTPKDGGEFDYKNTPQNFTFEFDENVTMTPGAEVTLACAANGYSQKIPLTDFSHLIPGNFIAKYNDLPASEQITENGTYTLTVPAGIFHQGANTNQVLTYTYNMTGFASSTTPDNVTVTSILLNGTPITDGMKLASIPADAKFEINTSDNMAVGYIHATLNIDKAVEGGSSILRTWESHALRTLPEKRGVFWTDEQTPFFENGRDAELNEGHVYTINITLYDFETPPYSRKELAKYSFTIEGTTPTYQYSDIELERVRPNAATTIFNTPEEAHFTMTFSGQVWVKYGPYSTFPISQGIGQKITESDVTYNTDHNAVTITFPRNLVKTSRGVLVANIQFMDSEGRVLNAVPENDARDKSYYSVEYTCYAGSPDLTVIPTTGNVPELKDFRIACPAGPAGGMIHPAWYGKTAVLKNEAGETVATFTNDDLTTLVRKSDKDGEYAFVMGLSLANTIKTPGKYTLTLNAGFINLGSEFNSQTSKQQIFEYTLTENPVTAVYDLDLTPSVKNVSESVLGVTLTAKDGEKIYPTYGIFPIPEAYVADKDGNRLNDIKVTFEGGRNSLGAYEMPDCASVMYQIFSVSDKMYELVVPQGIAGNEDWFNTNTYEGRANKEIRVKIAPSAIDSIEAAGTFEGDVYTVTGIMVAKNASAEEINALPAGLYIVNGKKIIVK